MFESNMTASSGNTSFTKIFEELNKIIPSLKKRNANEEVFIKTESLLRMVYHLSEFIIREFNYNESPMLTKSGRRRKNKYLFNYSCDDKNAMQAMRDVRNLFKAIDA